MQIQSAGGSYSYLELATPSSGSGYIIKNLTTGNSALNKSLYLWNADGAVQFVPSGVIGNATTVDTSGNLGVKVIPSAWSQFSVLQLGGSTYAGVASSNTYINLSTNVYYDGSNFKYITNGVSTRYQQSSGEHYWYTAPSGTAGATASHVQFMVLDDSGNLGLGSGTNPANWASGTESVLQIKNGAVYGYQNYEVGLTANTYYNAGWKYIETQTAAMIYIAGSMDFRVAAAGTAGTAITWTSPLGIAITGEVSFTAISRSWSYSAPSTTYKNIDWGGGGALFRDSYDSYLTSNTYYSTAGWKAKYTHSGGIGTWRMLGGDVAWHTYDGSVTAGTVYSMTDKFFISKSGNVGIGEAVDTFPNGDSLLIKNSGVWNVTIGLQNTGTGGRKWNIFSTNDTFSQGGGKLLFYHATSSSNPMLIDGSDRVCINTITASSTYGTLTVAGVGITIANDGNAKLQIGRYSSGVPNSYIKLGTSSNSLRITNNNDTADVFTIENGGNVGIGTTSPACRLHIESASASYGQFRITSTSNNTGEASINFGRTDQAIDSRWTVGQGVASIGDSFGFYTGGSPKVVINTSGDVGIGATLPGSKLDVRAGSNYPLILDSTQQYLLGLYRDGTAEWWLAVSGGDLKIHENGVGDQIIFKAGGNVGIGVSPNTKLDVNGTGLFRGRVTLGAGITTGQTYGQLNVWDTASGSGSSRMADFTNGTDANMNFYVSQIGATTKYAEIASYSTLPLVLNKTSGGNVGINIYDPAHKLTVQNGDIAIGNGNQTSGDFSQAQALHFLNETTTPLATIKAVRVNWAQGQTDLTFSTYNSGMSEKVRIAYNGAVGIGTTNLTGLTGSCLYIRATSSNVGQSAISIQDYLARNRWVINGQDGADNFSLNIYSAPSASNDFTRRLRIGQDGVFSFGGTDTTYRYNFEAGSVYIPGGQGGNVSTAYTSWNQLVFGDQYSDVARGPNKIVTYGRGGGWVAGIGIHNDTQAYYAGGTHKFYKFDGTTATLNLSLDGSGNLVATGDVTAYSDIRLKENIDTISSALEKTLRLRGVYYNKIGEEKRSLGVIAQEVEEVIPEVVSELEGYKGVSYGNMVGLLIEAVKELNKKIEAQDELIKSLLDR
jgi:hypothetical protein